jgi:hypothetical protein
VKRIFEWFIRLLSRHSNSLLINLWVPAGLASVIFACRFWPAKVAYPVGAIATVWLAIHAYALKAIKDKDLNQLDYWKRLATSYNWLLVCIERLISSKKLALGEPVTDRIAFGESSIERCLQMLLEFYVNNYGDPSLRFKVVFFVPSPDGMFLVSRHWCNRGEQAPYSHGDFEKQKVLFRISESQTLAVRAWTARSTQIAENESEVHSNYPAQHQTIRSLIAFPVTGERSTDVIGVITVAADRTKFFRRAELATHESYIRQFGIRIAFEMARMRVGGPQQREGA